MAKQDNVFITVQDLAALLHEGEDLPVVVKTAGSDLFTLLRKDGVKLENTGTSLSITLPDNVLVWHEINVKHPVVLSMSDYERKHMLNK